MDLSQRLTNFFNNRKRDVVSAVQQAPQQVASYGQDLLKQVGSMPLIRPPMNLPVPQATIGDVGNFLKPVAQQVGNTLQKGAMGLYENSPLQNTKNFTNPSLIMRPASTPLAKQVMNIGNVGNAAAAAYGLPKVGLQTAAGASLLGGGIEKLTGGSFLEGAQKGLAAAPSITGIGAITNPLINKTAMQLGGKVASPTGRFLVNRGATGALNVPEGMLMKGAVTDQAYGVEDAALDFAIGAAGGSQRPTLMKNDMVMKRKYDDVISAQEPVIRDVLVRYEKMFGAASDPANPVVDLNLEQEARNTWKMLYGLNKKEPERLDRVIGEIFEGYNGWRTERQMAGQGMQMGLVDEKVPQTFRTDKMNVGELEQDQLRRAQFKVGLEDRKVRSFEEMQADAEELGLDPKRLLKDVQQGRITDAEIVALKNAQSTSSQRIIELSKQLEQDPTNTALQTQLQTEEQFLNQMVRKLIKGGTEAGRSVVAFKILANKTMEPSYWLRKAQQQLGDKQLTADVVKKINTYIDQKDRLGLANYISKLGESTFGEKAVGLWKASLLTGLRTHEANMVGNTAMNILETAKDIPATGFDMARSFVTRTPRTKSFSLKGAVSQLKGTAKGFKRGEEILTTGIDPKDLAKAETNKPLRFGSTPLGRIGQGMTDVVFRTLGAEDKVFYETAYKRSLDEQMRVAKLNKMDLAEPTQEMIEQAAKDAEYATFTNDNKLSDGIRAFKKAGGPVVTAATDIIMPFTKTPTNVAKTTFVDYTPVGFVGESAKVIKNLVEKKPVDSKALAEAFGRATTGSAVLALGAELARRGLVAGSSPTTEAERSQWELEGKTPNSILVNGQWMSVSKISPVGNLILLGAAYGESGGDLAATAGKGLKGFSENSFLKGASEGLKVFNEPDRSLGNFASNAAAGYVPTLISDVARGMDMFKRKPEGLQEKVLTRLPEVRETVPAKLNALGEPVKEPGNFITRVANPFNPSVPSDDPLVNEFKRVGYNLNYVGETINDQGLTRTQQREYQELAGKYIKELVPQVISSEGYNELSKDVQKDIIEKAVNSAKTQAREEMKPKLQSMEEESGIAAEAAELDEVTERPEVDLETSVGSKTYTFVQDGKVKSISLNMDLKKPDLTGDADFDKKSLSKYKSRVTSEINDVYSLYEAKKLTLDQAKAAISRLEEKYSTGTGGGSGGRKKKGLTIDFRAFAKKLNSIKPVQIRLTKSSSTKSFTAPRISRPEMKELSFKGQPLKKKKR